MQDCGSERTANLGGEERVETDRIFYLFTVEKPDKHYLSWVIKVIINRDVIWIVSTLDMMG